MIEKRPEVLILGGTTEARLLATKLVDEFGDKFDIVTSFAGVTKNPRSDSGKTRHGGFGGVNGLVTYINNHHVKYLVDATHPFARTMPFNGFMAAEETGCSYIRLVRPPWDGDPNDDWYVFPSMEQAMPYLETQNKTTFLAVGSKDLNGFKDLKVDKIFARMIEKPKVEDIPKNCEILIARPPFDLHAEEALFSRLKIDILVMKNSGGNANREKINACQKLNISIVMITRPSQPKTALIQTVDAAYQQIKENLKS